MDFHSLQADDAGSYVEPRDIMLSLRRYLGLDYYATTAGFPLETDTLLCVYCTFVTLPIAPNRPCSLLPPG